MALARSASVAFRGHKRGASGSQHLTPQRHLNSAPSPRFPCVARQRSGKTQTVASRKPQAASRKPQAASHKPQATSHKPQATSHKPQATSHKRRRTASRGPTSASLGRERNSTGQSRGSEQHGPEKTCARDRVTRGRSRAGTSGVGNKATGAAHAGFRLLAAPRARG
jgi:hypothetical protein